jgi:signal transduction histidine kinase
MMGEKQRLEGERNQLNDKLSDIQSQLQELGIEDNITGLSQLITQLYEERASLKEQNHLLQTERDALLHERENFADSIGQEKDRDSRIRALEEKIQNLASDRETAVKLGDKMRKERDEIQNKLNIVKEHRARLLAQSTGYEIELRESHDEQMQLRAQIQELADVRSQLVHNRDKLVAENRALLTELEQAKSPMPNDSQDSTRINQEGMSALQKMVDELSQQRDSLERELNKAEVKLANIENELLLAHRSLEESQSKADTYKPNNPELLVGLVQELRTPMTSISGYVELLLDESAGILFEMQRKYLQRVGANVSRLATMIDSLVSVTHLDTGNFQLEPRPIDVIHVVEEAIINASIQFREKSLSVALELDNGMPLLAADEDSIKQIIEQLLSNAYLVTPPDNEIHVTVTRRRIQFSDAADTRLSLYVAIRDSGGGINPEDIEHVFARKYKADYPLIAGLGDTGVGLSIAKALVEAHEGKLWVDSETGIGSTFAFAIPFNPKVQNGA